MNQTAIIILNYNNYEDTFNCIETIEKYNTAPIKYFIIDNASNRQGVITTMDSYFRMKFSNSYIKIENGSNLIKNYPKLTFITSNINGGYAKGNNIGLHYAFKDEEIEYLMILNNDVLFVEDIIPLLIKKNKDLDNCGIVSPILFKKNLIDLDYNCARSSMSFRQAVLLNLSMGKPWFGIKKKIDEENYILMQKPESLVLDYVKIDYPSGSCMLASKELWQTINGFDPNTFLYYEEAILFSKTSKLGKINYLIPSLKCIHLGASSTSKSTSPLQSKLASKSKKYYMLNYLEVNSIQKIIIRLTLALGEFALWVKFDLLGLKNATKRF